MAGVSIMAINARNGEMKYHENANENEKKENENENNEMAAK
jgi:hypothetical protein